MSRRLAFPLLLGIVLISFYGATYSALLEHRNVNKVATQSSAGIWNLPSAALLALAGEFKGLVADYLTLEAGAQMGTQTVRKPGGGFEVVKKNYDWPSIHRIFVASQALDPSFAQTFLLAQGWLPWTPANMVKETQEILETAGKHRPWDWQPPRSKGFNAYYFLNQPGEAGKHFLEAAQRPNAPAFLPILGARLAQKGGETATAIVIMKSMLAEKNSEEPGYADMLDRLNALQGVLVIEEGIKKYQQTLGHPPASLSQLIDAGILTELPANPYKVDYCMDAAGLIYFDNVDCRAPASNTAGQ